ncbi:MAG: hypothetical protein M1355_02035 [Patescibacteria group bacterium]|nr:hypothetical protein [Patescibacteria group bacterium]
MNYWQYLSATFFGSIFGFTFSITLYYLTEKIKNNEEKKKVLSNLIKEIDFNISFLESYKEEFDKMLRKITVDDKNIYTIFKFDKLQRLFIFDSFNRGILYDFLMADEISELDSMLSYFSASTNNFASNTLSNYKEGNIDKSQALSNFEYDKEQIQRYLAFQKKLKSKIKNKKTEESN